MGSSENENQLITTERMFYDNDMDANGGDEFASYNECSRFCAVEARDLNDHQFQRRCIPPVREPCTTKQLQFPYFAVVVRTAESGVFRCVKASGAILAHHHCPVGENRFRTKEDCTRDPSSWPVLLTFTAGLLAAVFILRKVRRHRMDPVLLADPNSLYTVVLKRREAIGHNVKLLRFALPSYTQIRGPRGMFVYEGHGTFVTALGDRLPPVQKLGLIAAGSGVTPMLQLLRSIFADSTDCTLVRMIDVNHSPSEIIACSELNDYARTYSSTFRICHVLSEVPSLEMMPGVIRGPLNRYIMAAHLPAPNSKSLILCCGPPSLINDVCRPALADIGYKSEQVLFY
ncbi:hypothetical protein MRX96_026732 [Rhipicephalus microplus]